MFKRIRKRIKTCFRGPSLTEQKWKDRQDVNSIVARCLRGDTSGLKTCGFQFADVSDMPKTLQEMLNRHMDLTSAFDSLPTDAREHYGTPSRFLKALSDENEVANFRKFGLLKEAPSEPTPVKVEVINPVTPEGAA